MKKTIKKIGFYEELISRQLNLVRLGTFPAQIKAAASIGNALVYLNNELSIMGRIAVYNSHDCVTVMTVMGDVCYYITEGGAITEMDEKGAWCEVDDNE